MLYPLEVRVDFVLQENTRPPSSLRNKHGELGTSCWICTKEYQKYLLLVVYGGAMTFLGSSHLLKGLLAACPFSMGNFNKIPKLLLDHANFCRMVFGIKTVSMYCVDVFFFPMVASNILSFEKNSKGEVSCVLSKDNSGKRNYQHICFWSGFEFRSANPQQS